MEDYAGNSKKKKEAEKKEKVIKPVVTGEAHIQKKGLGQKAKDLLIAADFRTVTSYIFYDVFMPALKNMIVESTSRGIDRMMYGESHPRYRSGMVGQQIVSYNSPVRRGNSMDNLDRRGVVPNRPSLTDPSRARSNMNTDILFTTRDDAVQVLERMADVLEGYEVVTVGDLRGLSDLDSSHIDETWGWTDISSARVQQVRDGYLLVLPQPQHFT